MWSVIGGCFNIHDHTQVACLAECKDANSINRGDRRVQKRWSNLLSWMLFWMHWQVQRNLCLVDQKGMSLMHLLTRLMTISMSRVGNVKYTWCHVCVSWKKSMSFANFINRWSTKREEEWPYNRALWNSSFIFDRTGGRSRRYEDNQSCNTPYRFVSVIKRKKDLIMYGMIAWQNMTRPQNQLPQTRHDHVQGVCEHD